MKCGLCNRSKEEIIEGSTVASKLNSGTFIEVFYLTGYNQPVCARCMSEKLIPVRLKGNAYLTYYPGKGKTEVVKGIIINTEEIITEDTYTNAEREAISLEDRDKIEKMMSQT